MNMLEELEKVIATEEEHEECKVSLLEYENVLKTLPLSYYAGRPLSATLEEHAPTSYYDPIAFTERKDNMSYVKDYYSGDQKVDDFFCDGATNFDTEIADLNKKIAKTKASLEDTINERNNLYTKMYKGKYIAPKKKTYLCFNGRNNTFFFSIPDGQSVNPDQFGEEYETRDVDYKSGQFSVIVEML